MPVTLGLGLGIGFGRKKIDVIPYQSFSLFFFDGTVIGTNLIDKKNGWEFPLSATPDWDTSLKILPFRTAITVSAPANGTDAATAIQAVDVNNFWYASDGTANAIPFISFYQNIDFADKIFSKHVTQTVHGTTGEELTPAGLKYIAHYSTAQTAKIADMAAFYGSEVQPIAGAYYVSKSGNNTTGTGSLAAPWLTIDKAYQTVATDKTIYVLQGTYKEQSAVYGNCLYAGRTGTRSIIALGRVTMQSVSTDAVVMQDHGTLNLTGFIFDGETNTTAILNNISGANDVMNVYRCKFINAKTQNYVSIDTANTDALSLYDCVIPDLKTIVCYDPANIIRCYVNARTTFHKEGNFHYNKVKLAASQTFFPITNANSVKWNTFETYSFAVSYSLATPVVISYNTINLLYGSSNGLSNTVISINNDNCVPSILNNRMISTNTSIPAGQYYSFIQLSKCITPIIRGNYIRIDSYNAVLAIGLIPSTAGQGKCTIDNNFIKTNVTENGLGGISLGGQSLLTGKLDNSEITNNTFIGSLLDRPTVNPGSIHFLNMSAGNNFKVERNLFAYCSLALVLTNGNTPPSYTSGGINHNIFYQNKNDVVTGGIDALPINNNSFHFIGGLSGITKGDFISIWKSVATGVEATNIVVKNAIIHNADPSANVKLVYIDAYAAAHGCAIANCVLQNDNVSNALVNSHTTIAAIRAAGLDIGNASIEADPLFVGNGDLRLQAASPAKGMGLTISGTGLDITSEFTFTDIPTIVTAEQVSDAGAFVYQI